MTTHTLAYDVSILSKRNHVLATLRETAPTPATARIHGLSSYRAAHPRQQARSLHAEAAPAYDGEV